MRSRKTEPSRSGTCFDTLIRSGLPPELAVVVSLSISLYQGHIVVWYVPVVLFSSLLTFPIYGLVTLWETSYHLHHRCLVARALAPSSLLFYFSPLMTREHDEQCRFDIIPFCSSPTMLLNLSHYFETTSSLLLCFSP